METGDSVVKELSGRSEPSRKSVHRNRHRSRRSSPRAIRPAAASCSSRDAFAKLGSTRERGNHRAARTRINPHALK
jgi:hypothetical protein